MEQISAYRRSEGASHTQTLGPACAPSDISDDAWPNNTGRATPYAASADEPIRRPDYRAKKHTKPKKWKRADVRRICERAVEAALFGEVE